MSYFSDDEDDLNNSVSSDDNNSDDDIEPSTSPKKKINKEEISDELLDEDIDESELDENDDDSEAITDTDGEADYDYDEIEEIGQESKKSEKKKIESEKSENKKQSKSKNIKKMVDIEDEDDDDDENDNNYLQKFNESISENYILNNHPECIVHNYNEVLSMCRVIRDSNGIIIDDLHKTLPYLTKYERARILGVRAKQINIGATPFIKLTEEIIDGYIIAEMELKEKKIPFIIKRPMPNGGSEYWFLKDLEDLSF